MSRDGVRQVAVPPAARALSTLARIDYEDAFLVDTVSAEDRTAELWARAMLEDAPLTVRSRLLSAWTALGLRLRWGRSDRLVLGWELRRRSDDLVLLGADSRIGMPAELLFKRERHALLFATFVQKDNRIARAAWAAVEPMHGPTVRSLLRQADSRGVVLHERRAHRGDTDGSRSRSGPNDRLTRMALIQDLDFIGIPSQDAERARSFYRDVLGMRPDEHAEYEQWAGGTCFVVWEPERVGMEFVAQTGNPLPLRVEDVHAARAELESRGVTFFGETLDTGVCHMAIFADPDGNQLMLHHRYMPYENA